MTELSPQAQAVLDAALDADFCVEFTDLDATVKASVQSAVAAALRAAADQVAPDDYASFTGHIEWDQGMEARNDSIRDELLAIAAELEGSN